MHSTKLLIKEFKYEIKVGYGKTLIKYAFQKINTLVKLDLLIRLKEREK